MVHKIIFFGTSLFALPCLKALSADKRYEIMGVVTQPDRPTGRHAILTSSPIKVAAQELKIKNIWQPEKIKNLRELALVKNHGSDITNFSAFVIVSYGKILPEWLINLPKYGVINVHPSLLPRWRGPSPIQAALTAGDQKTGVTIMKLDAEMDHGPILAQKKIKIDPKDNGQILTERLSNLSAEILTNVLTAYLEGKIKPKEQDHAKATYCKILTRENGFLDYKKTAIRLDRQVRSYNPWPGAWIMINNKRLKILDTAPGHENKTSKPGNLFHQGGQPFLSCADGTSLGLILVQPEGKKPMSGKAWFQGVGKSFRDLTLIANQPSPKRRNPNPNG